MKINERIHGRFVQRNRVSQSFNRLLLTTAVIITAIIGIGPLPTTASAQDSEGGTKDISFDDLKFDIEVGGEFKRSMLTEEIEGLMGKPIRIRGYIRPGFQQDGIKNFILVRDNQECCFGPGAALYDCVTVQMTGGKTTSFTVRPVAVEGVLSVKELKGPDGNVWAIYRLKATSVR